MPSPARSVRTGTVEVSAERPREGSATMVLLRHLLGDALGAPLSQVLREVSDSFALAELQSEPVYAGAPEPQVAEPGVAAEQIRIGPAAARKIAVPEAGRFAVSATQPEFEQVTRGISDIKDMVPV